MYSKVLVAYDGSPYSNKALSAGIELTRCCGCELHAVAVVNLPDYAGTVAEVDDMVTRAREFYEKKLEGVVSRAAGKNVKLTTHLIFGHVGETIVRYAECRVGQTFPLAAHFHLFKASNNPRECAGGNLSAGIMPCL